MPNPLLPENRDATAKAVREDSTDIGTAWDGNFDKIIHNPRLTWNTIDIVTKAGGIPVMSKTGHAFIKERMRLENAVYGGEMSK